MASEFVSIEQEKLFAEISKAGELILDCGPKDISANIVGNFSIRHYPEAKEHRLEMGDGDQHVHIDWNRVKAVEYDVFHGEGRLTFKDGAENLFRMYRPTGEFSYQIKRMVGLLI